MLSVEFSELASWVSSVSRGELGDVDVEEEVESEAVCALRSFWTWATAVLESVTLPDARSLRSAARSLVRWAVVAVVGSAEVAEAVLAALAVEVVEEVLVLCVARSSCSIKAREEEERAEIDMGSFRRREIPLIVVVGTGSENFSGERVGIHHFQHLSMLLIGAYDGRVELPLVCLAVLMTIFWGRLDCEMASGIR